MQGAVFGFGLTGQLDGAAGEEQVLAQASAGNLIAVRVPVAVFVDVDRVGGLRDRGQRVAGDLLVRLALRVHRGGLEAHVFRQRDLALDEQGVEFARNQQVHVLRRVVLVFLDTVAERVVVVRVARIRADATAVEGTGVVQDAVKAVWTGGQRAAVGRVDRGDAAPWTSAQAVEFVLRTTAERSDIARLGVHAARFGVRQAEHQRSFFIAGAVAQREVLVLAVVLFVLAGVQGQLAALHVLFQDDVDHACDRVRAVNRRSAILQDFHALDHCRRDGRQVGEAVDRLGPALAVHQDQQAVRAQVTQTDVLAADFAVRRQRARAREVRSTCRRQVVQDVANGDQAGTLDLFLAHDLDWLCGFQVDLADTRTGHFDALQVLLLRSFLCDRCGHAEGHTAEADRADRPGQECFHHVANS